MRIYSITFKEAIYNNGQTIVVDGPLLFYRRFFKKKYGKENILKIRKLNHKEIWDIYRRLMNDMMMACNSNLNMRGLLDKAEERLDEHMSSVALGRASKHREQLKDNIKQEQELIEKFINSKK